MLVLLGDVLNFPQVCLLVSALASSGVDGAARKGTSSGDAHLERSELTASNPSAFGIIQSLLAECTPPVEAVCLQVCARGGGEMYE